MLSQNQLNSIFIYLRESGSSIFRLLTIVYDNPEYFGSESLDQNLNKISDQLEQEVKLSNQENQEDFQEVCGVCKVCGEQKHAIIGCSSLIHKGRIEKKVQSNKELSLYIPEGVVIKSNFCSGCGIVYTTET